MAPAHLTAASVAWLLGILPIGGSQAPGGRSPTPPRVEVTVDLANQTLTGRLPFDIGFDLVGSVPEDVRSIEVTWWDVTAARGDCRAGLTGSRDTRTAAVATCMATLTAQLSADSNAVKRHAAAGTRTWRVTTLSPGTGPRNFRIPVEALDAERSYVFRFVSTSTVSETKVAGFRAALRPALAPLLEALGDGDLTRDEYLSLRTTIRALMERITGRFAVLGTSSLFSAGDPTDAEVAAFGELVVQPILAVRANRRAVLATEYAPEVAGLERYLAMLPAGEAMARVLAAARTNADIAKHLGSHATALELLDLSPVARHAAALGTAAPPVTDLGEARSAADADPFIAQYRTLATSLGELRATLRLVLQPEGPFASELARLVTARKVTPADLAAARAVVADGGPVDGALDFLVQVGSTVGRVRRSFEAEDAGYQALAASIALSATSVTTVTGDTFGDFETSHTLHVSADAGVLYAFGMDGVVPYLGTNIYFRPVNRDAPLALRGGFWRRFSLTVGLTVKSIEDSPQTRDDLFGNQAAVVGFGWRVHEALRVGAGAVILRKKDPDPVRTDTSLGLDPFLAFSFDVDAKKLIGSVGGIFSSGE